MRIPQTTAYARRNFVLDLAFSIDMEHKREKYRMQKQRKHRVISCEELKARLIADGVLSQPERSGCHGQDF